MYFRQTPKSFHLKQALQSRKQNIDSTDDQKSLEKCSTKSNETSKVKYKTELCKNFSENGFCRYGKKCRFAHGFRQLKRDQQVKNQYYRTKKCQSFWSTGHCNYGSRCQFSHQDLSDKREILRICRETLCENNDDASCSRLFTILG